ncbi:hypothetical protein K1719_008855 [Acacia pycnantha]|nr:hypothetical protein K1719_008855 [Acacia pycnantha]
MDQRSLLEDINADSVNEDHLPITWRVFAEEVKSVCSVAVPMVIVNASTFFLQTITLMMVGHLGKLAQSNTGVAISLCAVTGFSVIFGLASALETLCQDPLIAHEAGKFAVCLIPALFGFLLDAGFKSPMGPVGGAFAIGASYWLNVIVLALYIRFSDSCEKTRVPISMELFQGIGEFFRYAIPSAIMACLQWWSYEVTTLLAGLLQPNPELEISILAVCVSMNVTIYSIPESIGSSSFSFICFYGLSTRHPYRLESKRPLAWNNDWHNIPSDCAANHTGFYRLDKRGKTS